MFLSSLKWKKKVPNSVIIQHMYINYENWKRCFLLHSVFWLKILEKVSEPETPAEIIYRYEAADNSNNNGISTLKGWSIMFLRSS